MAPKPLDINALTISGVSFCGTPELFSVLNIRSICATGNVSAICCLQAAVCGELTPLRCVRPSYRLLRPATRNLYTTGSSHFPRPWAGHVPALRQPVALRLIAFITFLHILSRAIMPIMAFIVTICVSVLKPAESTPVSPQAGRTVRQDEDTVCHRGAGRLPQGPR